MIILTGAAGFIGSNMAAALNAAGRTDLLLVDELGCQGKWKNIAKRRFEDLQHHQAAASLRQQLARADAVIHMGADSSTTAQDGDHIARLNLQSSMDWWRWCTQTRTPLIYASSAATYGDGAAGFADGEDRQTLDALRPLNLYGWSKHAFDRWATERAAEGLAPPQWAGLKFYNVYGPNEYHKADMQSLVAKNTQLVASGQTVKLFKSYREPYPDGGQLRDFVYVKDCCDVMMWLLAHPGVSGLFNLGTGQARSFSDLIHAIGSACQRPADIEFVDMPPAIRPNYQYYTQADMRKLRARGYSADFTALADGVADYVCHYLTQPDPYR